MMASGTHSVMLGLAPSISPRSFSGLRFAPPENDARIRLALIAEKQDNA